jgi:hypothetical protein
LIYLGVDWAEAHHDLCLLDEAGRMLGKGRVPEGLDGLRRVHELVADHTDDATTVVVGIETDRGLLVQGLIAAGYQVYAINPLAVSRYRDRHATSGAKSDPGDAKVLADLVRTDAHNHRPVAGDSELAEAIKILARAHQSLVWSRRRAVNQLRSTLREFYPAALEAFGTDLGGRDAVALLERSPTPAEGRTLSLSKIRATLERAGRQRNLDARAAEIQQALRAPQLQPLWGWLGRTAVPCEAACGSLPSSTSRWPLWRRSWPRLLKYTRTPRSFAVFPDLVWSSAPGSWASSATTEPATRMPGRGGAMPAWLQSPVPQGPAWSSWRALPATAGSRMPCTSGPSPR